MLSKIFLVVLLTGITLSQGAYFSDSTQSTFSSPSRRNFQNYQSGQYQQPLSLEDLDLGPYIKPASHLAGTNQHSSEEYGRQNQMGWGVNSESSESQESAPRGHQTKYGAPSQGIYSLRRSHHQEISEEQGYSRHNQRSQHQSRKNSQESSEEVGNRQGIYSNQRHNSQEGDYGTSGKYGNQFNNQQGGYRMYRQNPQNKWQSNNQEDSSEEQGKNRRTNSQSSSQESSSEEIRKQQRSKAISSKQQSMKKLQNSLESASSEEIQGYRAGYAPRKQRQQQKNSQESSSSEEGQYQKNKQNSQESSSEEGNGWQKKHSYTKAHYNSKNMKQRNNYDSNESLGIRQGQKQAITFGSGQTGGRFVQNKQGTRGGSSSSEESSNESQSQNQRNTINRG